MCFSHMYIYKIKISIPLNFVNSCPYIDFVNVTLLILNIPGANSEGFGGFSRTHPTFPQNFIFLGNFGLIR